MEIRCVWEHNGNDSLLYAVDHPGAYTRGETREIALSSNCLYRQFEYRSAVPYLPRKKPHHGPFAGPQYLAATPSPSGEGVAAIQGSRPVTPSAEAAVF